MTMNPEKARLRWSCRRGMLELDVFLLPFFDECYDQLSVAEQGAFEKLLPNTDPELYSWLNAEERAPEEFVALVQSIRQFRSPLLVD